MVTGVEEFGLFVQGIELPAEGLVHVASLQDDYYRYERGSHTLSGYRSGNSYRLGDLIEVVKVARVDVDRRELDFRLVGRGERKSAFGLDRRHGRPTTHRGRPRRKTSHEGRTSGWRSIEAPPRARRRGGGPEETHRRSQTG